jgi:hypothetical protein
MGGFYNIFFDRNPYTKEILAALGLEEEQIERYRDCGVNWFDKHIWVYTRTGGQNRQAYPNTALTTNKYYQRNEDDSYDRTYAVFYFEIPENLGKLIPVKRKPDWAAFFERLDRDSAFKEECFRKFMQRGSQNLEIITVRGNDNGGKRF